MSARPIPDGYHTITPNIIVKDAEQAVDFYKRAFGAVEKMRLTMPDGKITHCELQIGDSHLNLGEAMEGWPAHSLLRSSTSRIPTRCSGARLMLAAR